MNNTEMARPPSPARTQPLCAGGLLHLALHRLPKGADQHCSQRSCRHSRRERWCARLLLQGCGGGAVCCGGWTRCWDGSRLARNPPDCAFGFSAKKGDWLEYCHQRCIGRAMKQVNVHTRDHRVCQRLCAQEHECVAIEHDEQDRCAVEHNNVQREAKGECWLAPATRQRHRTRGLVRGGCFVALSLGQAP